MGIEPTGHMISMQPDGFEDRGQHQLNKHFHASMLGSIEVLRSLSRSPTLVVPLRTTNMACKLKGTAGFRGASQGQ